MLLSATPLTREGIKRAGNAMIMGQLAASNTLKIIHWQQQQQQQQPIVSPDTSVRDELFECPDLEHMMALSVGDEAVAYTKASGVI